MVSKKVMSLILTTSMVSLNVMNALAKEVPMKVKDNNNLGGNFLISDKSNSQNSEKNWEIENTKDNAILVSSPKATTSSQVQVFNKTDNLNDIRVYPLSIKNSKDDFEFSKETGTITKYIGNETEVNIPKEIDGVLVTNIGNNAFSDCSNIKSVATPDSIENIGKYAFYNCGNLETVSNLNGVVYI